MSVLVFLFTGIVIGFIIGVLSTLLFTKNKQPVKTEIEPVAEIKPVENIDPRIIETRELINIVKNGQKIECYCNPKILKGIKLLASEPEWEKQIDDETLNILSGINIKRKEFIKSKKQNSNIKTEIKINKENSHVKNKVWEGTEQEYIEASENGLIDEFTTVDIIEDESDYHGSWLVHNDDGSVEEYMD